MPTPAMLMDAADRLEVAETSRPWRRTAAAWLAGLAIYWITLFVGTHLPNPADLGGRVMEYDKLIHASAYAVLTTLCLIAWRRTGGATRWRTRLAFAALILAYGAFDEATQPFFMRACDLADWVADAAGVSLAVALDAWRHRRD